MKQLFVLFILAAAGVGLTGCSSASDHQKALYDNDMYIAGEADSWSYFSRIVKPDGVGVEKVY